MWREREAKRAKGEREREEEGWGSREQQEGRVLGGGPLVTGHTSGQGQPRAGEHRMNRVEVPHHDPVWARATLDLGTLLLPLGFQTLQQVWDPAGVWDKATQHCYFSAMREVPTQVASLASSNPSLASMMPSNHPS